MASKFAIFVTVKVKDGMGKEFLPHIMENAVAAKRDEENCQDFRVMIAQDTPDTFHFFEVYTDEASLDNHRLQPHYVKFREATQDMIEERIVQPLTVQF